MAERSTTKTKQPSSGRVGFNGQFTHCVNQESRHSSYSSSLQQPHAGDATVGNFHFITKKKKKKTVFESTVCFLCTIKNIKLNFKSSYQRDEKGQSRSGGRGGGRTTSTTVGRERRKRREGRGGRRVQKQGSSKEVRGGRDGERLGSPPPLPAVLCNTVHFGFQILLLFYSKKTKQKKKPAES